MGGDPAAQMLRNESGIGVKMVKRVGADLPSVRPPATGSLPLQRC